MGEFTVPAGWAQSNLADTVGVSGLISDGDWVESKDQDPNGSVRLIQLADIGDGDFRDKSARFMSPEKAEKLNCTYLKKGDVLIARMPDPLGRACIFPEVGQDAVTVVDICLVRTTETSAISSSFLKYWINSPEFRGVVAENASGTTRKRITRKKLEKFDFPLPPLAEQKIIAQKLDALLAQVENTKARLERTRETIKRFRQSVLAAAVSGKLTVSDTSKWEKLEFEKLTCQLRSGSAEKPSSSDSGIPILRSSAVRRMAIDYDDIKYLEHSAKTNADNYLRNGDLLFTRLSGSADYVGNCALVKGLSHQVQYPDRLFCARLKEQKHAKYLEYFFSSDVFKSHIFSSLKSSAGHQRITLGVIKKAIVVLPPLEEQSKIVHKIEQLFTHADTIENQTEVALAKVNNLTQSILAKAFRGELTEQWRKDNPELISGENSAEALLEKIKAEREAAKPKRKTRKKS